MKAIVEATPKNLFDDDLLRANEEYITALRLINFSTNKDELISLFDSVYYTEILIYGYGVDYLWISQPNGDRLIVVTF